MSIELKILIFLLWIIFYVILYFLILKKSKKQDDQMKEDVIHEKENPSLLDHSDLDEEINSFSGDYNTYNDIDDDIQGEFKDPYDESSKTLEDSFKNTSLPDDLDEEFNNLLK